MTLATLYPWLKGLHVAAALTFVGGVLAASLVLAAGPDGGARVVPVVRRWDGWVTTPALLLVWALGLTLGTMGDWFTDAWLQAKLVAVLVLSGLHGIQSGRLRRLAGGAAVRPMGLAPLVLLCALVIAVLAVVKPG